MKGHTHLIALRMEGLMPPLAFVDTDRSGTIDDWLNTVLPDSAHVWIEPTDRLDRIDLRCFVGLTVSVTGRNESRVEGVFEALLRAGAKRVFAGVQETSGEGEYQQWRTRRFRDSREAVWQD